MISLKSAQGYFFFLPQDGEGMTRTLPLFGLPWYSSPNPKPSHSSCQNLTNEGNKFQSEAESWAGHDFSNLKGKKKIALQVVMHKEMQQEELARCPTARK